jgi:hypothetical protein
MQTRHEVRSASASAQDHRAGQRGLAVAPPGYGIDFIDRGVVQRKWDPAGPGLQRWDRLRGGLRWYYVENTDQMYFTIESRSPLPESWLKQYGDEAGQRRSYQQWTAVHDMWGPEPAEAAEPVSHLALAVPDAREAEILTHVRAAFPGYKDDERISKFVDTLIKDGEPAVVAKAKFDKSKWLFEDRGVRFVPEKSRPSLSAWLSPEVSLRAIAAYVNVANTGTSAKGILWTRSVQGCLGVAAAQGGKAFLAHFDPGQLKDAPMISVILADIVKQVGKGADMVLCSMVLKRAPYILEFKQLATQAGFNIKEEVVSDRLAVQAESGKTSTDFNTDQLSTM